MSLINDLLCDLESRDAATTGTGALSGLRPVSGLARTPDRRWLVPLAATLIATSAFAILQRDADTDIVASSQAVPAVTIEATALSPRFAPTQQTDLTIAAHSTERLATSSPALSSLSEFSRSLLQRPRPASRPRLAHTFAAKPSLALAPAIRHERGATPAAAPATVAVVRADVVVAAAATTRDLRRAGIAALGDAQPQVAETHLRKLVERQPELADGWLYLARSVQAQGHDSEAEGLLVEALETVADKPPVARELARHLLTRKATTEALKLLEAYRPGHALDVEHDAFLAAVLQRLGQHDRAAERYRAVLAVRPESSAWWVGLAISEEARGQLATALDAYRHARNIGNLDTTLATYTDQRIAAMQGGDPS